MSWRTCRKFTATVGHDAVPFSGDFLSHVKERSCPGKDGASCRVYSIECSRFHSSSLICCCSTNLRLVPPRAVWFVSIVDVADVPLLAAMVRTAETVLVQHWRWRPPSKGFGEAHPHNPKVEADMTALHHLHEAGILYNLGQRADLKDQKPYTFMVSRRSEATRILFVGMVKPCLCGAELEICGRIRTAVAMVCTMPARPVSLRRFRMVYVLL